MGDEVTTDDVFAMLRELADAIQTGNAKSVTLKMLVDGALREHTINMENQEERDMTLASITKILGRLH
jgi:hypothetical protein